MVAVESQKLNAVLALPAQIIPYETVDIYPKVTGFIDTIRVDRGSHVRAGEVIIRLSAPELVAQRAQAEASLQAAQSQLSAAQAKLASDEGTYQHLSAAAKTPGVVAGNDLHVSEQSAAADRAQAEAAANNVRAAQDALRSVKQLESYLEIAAPFSGVVTLEKPSSGCAGGTCVGNTGRAADCPNRRSGPLTAGGSSSEKHIQPASGGPAGGVQRAGISRTYISRSDCPHCPRCHAKYADDGSRTGRPERRWADHARKLCHRRMADSALLPNDAGSVHLRYDGPSADFRDSCATGQSEWVDVKTGAHVDGRKCSGELRQATSW